MNARDVKHATKTFTAEQIAAAIAEITEEETLSLEVRGEDLGEKLTHLLLAQRIQGHIAKGMAFKDAFRAEMGAVRDVLTNDD